MKSFFRFLAVIAFSMNVVSASEPHRPCQRDDLIGKWKLKHIVNPNNLQGSDPLLARYQLREFHSDGKIRHYSGTSPLEGSSEYEVVKTMPSRNTFEISSGGMVLVKEQNQPIQSFLCTYSLTETQGPAVTLKKGDILLTWSLKGRPALMHLYEKY